MMKNAGAGQLIDDCSALQQRPSGRHHPGNRDAAVIDRGSDPPSKTNTREDRTIMSSGRIVQVIGAVIDVEFPRENVPKVYDALRVAGQDLTLEVQQQLGDGVVRAIAMGSSEGIGRGLEVENTGAPISVPVGEETLGRIMNVLGEPIDEKGPVNAAQTLPIHRAAPSYEDQSGAVEILETGIKVIDLVPFAKGGKVGSSVVPVSARPSLCWSSQSLPARVSAPARQRLLPRDDRRGRPDKISLVFGQMNELPRASRPAIAE